LPARRSDSNISSNSANAIVKDDRQGSKGDRQGSKGDRQGSKGDRQAASKATLPSTSHLGDTPYHIAFGSRSHIAASTATQRKWYRNLLMYGFHFAVKLLVNTNIKDTQCGFKLFTRPAARLIFGSLHLTRWAFDIEIVHIADLVGFRILEIPVTWTEVSGSKLNVVSASIQMLRDMFAIRLLYAMGVWKPRFDLLSINQSPSDSSESWVIT